MYVQSISKYCLSLHRLEIEQDRFNNIPTKTKTKTNKQTKTKENVSCVSNVYWRWMSVYISVSFFLITTLRKQISNFVRLNITEDTQWNWCIQTGRFRGSLQPSNYTCKYTLYLLKYEYELNCQEKYKHIQLHNALFVYTLFLCTVRFLVN
jgi:hypothetical protein